MNKTMVLVMNLTKKIETNTGIRVGLANKDTGHLGMMSVYESKAAAKRACGKNVKLAKIIMADEF